MKKMIKYQNMNLDSNIYFFSTYVVNITYDIHYRLLKYY